MENYFMANITDTCYAFVRSNMSVGIVRRELPVSMALRLNAKQV
jgi:hypothetical protein